MSTNVPSEQQLAYAKLKLDHERDMYKAETERLKVHVDGYNAKTVRWKVALHAIVMVVLVCTGSQLAAGSAQALFNHMISSISHADKVGEKKSD